MKRESGILLPISALPSKYGIGGFGVEAYNTVDFLASAKQKLWQILPLVQTGYGNSPYSSVSAYSFNPFFISLEVLKDKGLLSAKEIALSVMDGKYIDYGALYNIRYPLLKKAFYRFDTENPSFKSFIRRKEFYDYALFMALKEEFFYKPFYEWDVPFKYRDEKALKQFDTTHKAEICFWQFIQFEAQSEWFALKKYANKKGVKIIGDMPLYVAFDSVDVWTNPSHFKLDENLMPKKVAGVPPDYFSRTGQLWGNPVYDYEKHEKEKFEWWINRLKKALFVYDYVRIDHFRGFDRYYEVNFGANDAINGEWVKVPSEKLFTALHKEIKSDRVIAEDLGIIDDGVRELLKFTGYPGMSVLSFAFNGEKDNLYLPENIKENSVCYTGTHDNDTLIGLIKSASEWDKNNIVVGVKNSLTKLGLDCDIDTDEELAKAIINLGFASKANVIITPYQDILLLGTDYRMNEPGTVKEQNWAVKFKKGDFSKTKCAYLEKLTQKYNR